MNDIVAAAANLQEAAEASVETAQVTADVEIEAARLRAESAERRAQEITDAALLTETGRQVSALREDFTSWRTPMETQLATIQQTQAEILTRLSAPAPSSSIPVQLPAPPQEPVIVPAEAEQDDAGGPQDQPPNRNHPAKKARRIM